MSVLSVRPTGPLEEMGTPAGDAACLQDCLWHTKPEPSPLTLGTMAAFSGKGCAVHGEYWGTFKENLPVLESGTW